MPKYNRSVGPRYDTPTDGISRKVFDRYKDQQVRKHVQVMQRIQEIERQLLGSSIPASEAEKEKKEKQD